MDGFLDFLVRGAERLIARADGPLHFRLVVMPLVVTFLALRAHRRDVREGRPTRLGAFFTDPAARTELQSKHFAAHAEAAKEIGAARDGLYAVLTPEQKATADRVIGFPGFARRGYAAPGS